MASRAITVGWINQLKGDHPPLEIAELLGLSRSYVYELLGDPEGYKVRARKEALRGSCRECGGPTDGSSGHQALVCRTCITWTRRDAIEAVQAFFDDTGRAPTEVSGVVSSSTADRLFGGWNAMLLAAELPLNCDRRPETEVEMERLLAQGASASEVAAALGWRGAGNVHQRLRWRGLTVGDLGGLSWPERWASERAQVAHLYLDGLTYDEIAERMGTTRGAISSRIRTLRNNGYDLPYRQ